MALLACKMTVMQVLGRCFHICLQQWTGEATLGDALHTTLARLPRVKFMITTLGKKGSVLIARSDSQTAAQETDQEAAQEAVLEDLLHSMLKNVSSNHAGDGDGDGDSSRLLGCTARDGTHIK